MNARTFTVTILAALLAVLAPATAAAAECAWVLWRGVSNVEVVPVEAWYLGDAFETRADCLRAATQQTNAEYEEAKAYKVRDGALHSFKRTEAGVTRRIVEADAPDKTILWTASSFKCFPSTIDPRGPKGGR